jgi:hypothetical protein
MPLFLVYGEGVDQEPRGMPQPRGVVSGGRRERESMVLG